MKPFFQVQTVAQVHARLQDVSPLASEPVDLLEAGGRTRPIPLARVNKANLVPAL